ncbi:heat shock protein YegD [Klebsiella michiganensis]|nr:heat shock protein YegD [Klebsiella michiganensis]
MAGKSRSPAKPARHSGCRVGGNDLDIALAFKCLMPLLGMGGDTEKGIALPILPWWNAVAINDVPAQTDFYKRRPTVACLTICCAAPAIAKKSRYC